MKYYIGFDCGTMGTKVALYNADGQCMAESYRETETHTPHLGWVEMDANRYYESIKMGIIDCLQKSKVDGKDVRGISASGIVDGTVPVDEDFNPVGPFIPYLDMRAQEQAKWTRENCEPIWEYESGKSGIGPDCVPMVMKWLIDNKAPSVEKAKKFVNIAPFVLAKLGGLKAKDAFVDWSHASGWCIGFDLEKDNWSEKQFKMYGIPMEWLPKVVAPYDVVGHICKEVAAETGLSENCAIVAGAGDLMVSSLGAGVTEPGKCFDVAGTASIMTFTTTDYDAVRANKVLVTSKSVFNDVLMPWGCLSSGGFSNGWFRDGILNLKGYGGAYAMMDSEASKIPAGAEGALFLPYLTGTMTPSWPQAKAGWLGLTPKHSLPHMWRAMMEAVAMEYRMFLDSLESQGVKYDGCIGVGGGSRSKVWCQIKADVMNLPYTVVNTADTGALGNCALAAYGAGDVAGDPHAMVDLVKSWTSVGATFQTRPEYVDFYEKLFRARDELVYRGPVAEIFDRYSTIDGLVAPK